MRIAIVLGICLILRLLIGPPPEGVVMAGIETIVALLGLAAAGGGTYMQYSGQKEAADAAKSAQKQGAMRGIGQAFAERRNPMNVATMERVFQEFLGARPGAGSTYASLMGSTNLADRQLAQYLAKPKALRTPQEQQLVSMFERGGMGAVRQAGGNIPFWAQRQALLQRAGVRGGRLPGQGPELSALGAVPEGQAQLPGVGTPQPGMFDAGLSGPLQTDLVSPEQMAQSRGVGFQDAMRQLQSQLARTGMTGSTAALQAGSAARLANIGAASKEKMQAAQMNRQALYDAQSLMDQLSGLYSGFGSRVG
jgi:hypothetical protein